ncbi:hypothetical protein [Paenibacillus tuaregi]|uniref:hypothetical protein n=1 Tax=Paenibacillus tuaregi TaxID=1816681 RepID=UPI000838C4EE|nr:hypothetical protein [Paenibacillus tuaregi]
MTGIEVNWGVTRVRLSWKRQDAGYESGGRILIKPEDAGKYHQGWNEVYEEILQCAMSVKHVEGHNSKAPAQG